MSGKATYTILFLCASATLLSKPLWHSVLAMSPQQKFRLPHPPFFIQRLPEAPECFRPFPMQMPISACLAAMPMSLLASLWTRSADAIWIPNLILLSVATILSLGMVLRRIPSHLEDAAILDGCGFWRTLWRIVLPRLAPVLLVAGVIVLIGGWEDVMGPQISTHSGSIAPLSISSTTRPGPAPGTLLIENMAYINPGAVVALLMLFLSPVIAFLYLTQRFLIHGRFTSPEP